MTGASAYKVLTGGQWSEWQGSGVFVGAPVDVADGYVHLSTADQLEETIAKHFAGVRRLVVVTVDLAALGDLVRWEPSRGGALFPHVYGIVPMSAVRSAMTRP